MNDQCKHNAPPIIKKDGIYCRLCGEKLEPFPKEAGWAEVERFMNNRNESK